MHANHATQSNKTARFLLKPLLLAALALSPLALLPTAHAGFLDGMQIQIGNQTKSTFTIGNSRYDIRIKGEVDFSDAEDDVLSVSGKAMFEETRNGKKYRIEYVNDDSGKLQRRYQVDGREQALDAEGKKWLGGMIAVVLRETALNAKNRVNRLIGNGGADAVLAEIDLIQADYARRVYMVLLCKSASLNASQQQRLLSASARISSDFEVRIILTALLKHQTLDASAQAQVLNQVGKMESDFEQRLVLSALTPTMANEPGVLHAWQKALATVESDFESRLVLTTLAKRGKLSTEQLDAALQASMKLESDFEHRLVLSALAKQMRAENLSKLGNYLQSAQKISSDFERRLSMVALLEQGKLGQADYLPFLNALKGMDSDFEVGIVLKTMAKQMPTDADLLERYRQVAATLGDFERGQAEKALVRRN